MLAIREEQAQSFCRRLFAGFENFDVLLEQVIRELPCGPK
jgi:hypothetical protein